MLDYKSKVEFIARANGLSLRESAQVAHAIGLSNVTVLKVRDKPGYVPRTDAAEKIDAAYNEAKRKTAGYDQQTTDVKRRRLVGMIGAMSDFAVERYYEMIAGVLARDLQAEINGGTAAGDEAWEAAMSAVQKALASDQGRGGGRATGGAAAA